MGDIKICVIGAGRWGKKIDKATFDEGLDVVKILEMATNSLTNKTLHISASLALVDGVKII